MKPIIYSIRDSDRNTINQLQEIIGDGDIKVYYEGDKRIVKEDKTIDQTVHQLSTEVENVFKNTKEQMLMVDGFYNYYMIGIIINRIEPLVDDGYMSFNEYVVNQIRELVEYMHNLWGLYK